MAQNIDAIQDEQTSSPSSQTGEQKNDRFAFIDEEVREDLKTPEDKPSEVVTLTKDEYETLKKREQDAENYKRENEKYRTKRVEGLNPPAKDYSESQGAYEDPGVVEKIQTDYLSKKQDVLHDFTDEINSLSQEQFETFQPLYSAIDSTVYSKAVGEKRFVARGEISKQIDKYLSFVKGSDSNTEAVRKARLEGQMDSIKADNADIGVGSTLKATTSSPGVTAEDKKYSAQSGGYITPERAKEIRIAKEAREREYAPND